MSAKRLIFETTAGSITIALRPDAAPETCKAMTGLVVDGLFTGKTFYRAEPGFVVQGGLRDASGNTTPSPFGKLPLEYKLPNKKYTVTMARWTEPNTATSEFFINLADNTNLDRSGSSDAELGYAVWGEIVEGKDVLAAIEKMPTTVTGGLKMLTKPVTIVRATAQK